ncbi:hypothetical protein KGM_215302 [Danaus plexippus plexippus]|uniref:Uncharacterized protein n=1 Tax=Danaus plexippus plexippus TaxID=278856 RepID=A0A212F5D3_DANPL|nr:hypothetical protein KGM_215302 [Danaus plexippus plexippus]
MTRRHCINARRSLLAPPPLPPLPSTATVLLDPPAASQPSCVLQRIANSYTSLRVAILDQSLGELAIGRKCRTVKGRWGERDTRGVAGRRWSIYAALCALTLTPLEHAQGYQPDISSIILLYMTSVPGSPQ